ncbi:LysR substrate-binding domain-containing protein [Niveibacterium umoris]|uniref:DNA-binding transcriptional LysR family regulator n=1 Tax=Niveibacterium umoris TaxID=1193620 RepID=A0A840BLX5_9RHOO|nr:LysR substrate-binding domain-containing protein [Niveibacterium umoris]MBB4012652.1 DNA-binding transcriptional LysR family regulator [Niveibacterium umoris]
MKISLEALMMLDAIETRGSFAAAAEALHRVPSALTHAVRKLEEDLGFPLFHKVGRRAVLTPAGRTLLDDGRVLLRAAGDLECRARRIATGWESELRIAIDGTLDAAALNPIIAEFYADYGGTRLKLMYEVLGGTWDALATGRADLVIGAVGDPPAGATYATREWGNQEFLFCVAPHHPLAVAPEPIPTDLARQYRAVVVSDTSRQLVARTAGLLDGQDTLTVPDIAAKAAAQRAGLGIGHLPRQLAEREAAAGRLVVKRLNSSTPRAPLWLAWQSNQRGRALQWFVERLLEPDCAAALQAPAG